MKKFFRDFSTTLKVVICCLLSLALVGALTAILAVDEKKQERTLTQVTIIDVNGVAGREAQPLFTKTNDNREAITASLVVADGFQSEQDTDEFGGDLLVQKGADANDGELGSNIPTDESDEGLPFESSEPYTYDIKEGDTLSFEITATAAREQDKDFYKLRDNGYTKVGASQNVNPAIGYVDGGFDLSVGEENKADSEQSDGNVNMSVPKEQIKDKKAVEEDLNLAIIEYQKEQLLSAKNTSGSITYVEVEQEEPKTITSDYPDDRNSKPIDNSEKEDSPESTPAICDYDFFGNKNEISDNK